MLSVEDLDAVRESLGEDSSAVVVVYEETWARHLAQTVRGVGGEVALHVQLPSEVVKAGLLSDPLNSTD